MQKRRFAKEFDAEAVRLVHTTGRKQREVADDLGIRFRPWFAGSSRFHGRKDRPACHRQRQDMLLLTDVRSAFKLSNGTYGSLR